MKKTEGLSRYLGMLSMRQLSFPALVAGLLSSALLLAACREGHSASEPNRKPRGGGDAAASRDGDAPGDDDALGDSDTGVGDSDDDAPGDSDTGASDGGTGASDGGTGASDGGTGASDGAARDGDGGGTAGASDASSAPQGLVPAFAGQGHLGRTLISCDDGHTWIFDQADEVGDGTCWSGESEIECDHNPGAGRGLTAGNGQFFALFGWGAPSTLRRTADGQTWDTRIGAAPEQRFGGVGYVGDTLLAAGITARVSRDDGLTWSEPIDTGLMGGNVRRAGGAGAHFVIVTDEAIVLSENKGDTWYAPTVLPTGCGAGIQTNGGIAFGNGVILVMGNDGLACASSDGGRNFSATNIGGNSDSHLVWSGSDFVVYGEGNAYRSADGKAWTVTPMSPSYPIGPVAVSDSGTFVGVEDGWGDTVWYENQEFYRSEDGIVWEALPAGSFTGGHPMRTMTFGYIAASEKCQPRDANQN